MKEICKRRHRNGQEIVGNARFYLPRDDARKVAFENDLTAAKAELEEEARLRAEEDAEQDQEEGERSRPAPASQSPRKRGRQTRTTVDEESSDEEVDAPRGSKNARTHTHSASALTGRSSQVGPILPTYSEQAVREAAYNERNARVEAKRRAQAEIAERKAEEEARRKETEKRRAPPAREKKAKEKAKAKKLAAETAEAPQASSRQTRAAGRVPAAEAEEDTGDEGDQSDAAEDGQDVSHPEEHAGSEEPDRVVDAPAEQANDSQADGADSEQTSKADDNPSGVPPTQVQVESDDTDEDDVDVPATTQEVDMPNPTQDTKGGSYRLSEDEEDVSGSEGAETLPAASLPVSRSFSRNRQDDATPRATRARASAVELEPPRPRTRAAVDRAPSAQVDDAAPPKTRPKPPKKGSAALARNTRQAAAIKTRISQPNSSDEDVDLEDIPGAKTIARRGAARRAIKGAAKQQAQDNEDEGFAALTSEGDIELDDPDEAPDEKSDVQAVGGEVAAIVVHLADRPTALGVLPQRLKPDRREAGRGRPDTEGAPLMEDRRGLP